MSGYDLWSRYNAPRRHAQFARVLRIPIAAVEAWEADDVRRFRAMEEWDAIRQRHVPWQDNVARRAIGMCRRHGFSVAEVRAADDRALAAVDGMGPQFVRVLRAMLSGPAAAVAPPAPLPWWISEE